MNKNILLISVCFITTLITSCDRKEKISGKREYISGIIVSQKVDPSKALQNEKIIPVPESQLSSYVDVSGNKQHTSFNHSLKNPYNLLWKTSIGSGPINSDIIAFKENIYAIDSKGNLSCISQKDGKILWRKNIAKQPSQAVFSGGLTANNDIIYITTNIGKVIAIDTKNQKELWNKDIKYPIKGAPFYIDNKLIITSINNQTFAIDSLNGDTIWTKASNPEETIMLESASPAISGSNLICAYSSGDLLSIDLKTGIENWNEVLFSSNVSESGFTISHIAASPIIYKDYVLAATSESKTVLLDIPTGARIWEQNIGTLTTPAINNDWAFMLTDFNNVTCLSLKNGDIKWQLNLRDYYQDKRYSSYKWSGPIIINGSIFVFSQIGDIVELDISTGKIKNQKSIKGISFARSPILVNKKMFVITSSGEIAALG